MKNNNCPEFDDISAWHDGESQVDYSQHIEKCSDCQDIIEDLKKMDSGLNLAFCSPQPDAELQKKITQQDFDKKAKPILFTNLLKVAAILITAFAINFFFAENTEEVNLAKNENIEKQPVTLSSAPQIDKQTYTPIAEGPKSIIPNQDFTLVSTTDNSKIETTSTPLKSEIKHVWIANSLDKLSDTLNERFKDNKTFKMTTDKSGSLIISIALNEKALLSAVNWLSINECKLVSRDLPQPNQHLTSLDPKKIIKYEFSIIKKK